MIILDIEGLALSAEDKELLLHPHVSGVIFFSRNFESCEQIAAVSAQIKQLRPELVLCVDQEGGRVQRFTKGLTKLPPLGILGQLVDTQEYSTDELLNLSEHLGTLMAIEVRSLGVDLSFAPILDLNKGVSEIIGNRAFHSDPIWISQLAGAYIKGMEKVGMKATGKHFPGHGSVALDSHVGLPHDPRTLVEISDDIAPFKTLIAQKIPALMTAHIVFDAIDSAPVSFSEYWLKTVLRKQLNYQGVIISDDLSMGGAVGMGSYLTRAERAIDAGCDSILVCNNRAGAIEVVDGLKAHPDPMSAQRRLQLLANKPAPTYEKLKDSPLWQQAVTVLDALNATLS